MLMECMVLNLPSEWKPRLLRYLSADYASPIFKYLKQVIIIFELLMHHLKSKGRAPVYLWVLRWGRGVVRRI